MISLREVKSLDLIKLPSEAVTVPVPVRIPVPVPATQRSSKEEKLNPLMKPRGRIKSLDSTNLSKEKAEIDSVLTKLRLEKKQAVEMIDAAFAEYEQKICAEVRTLLSQFEQIASLSMTDDLFKCFVPAIDKLTDHFYQYHYARQGLGHGDAPSLLIQYKKIEDEFAKVKDKFTTIANKYENGIEPIYIEMKEWFEPKEIPPNVQGALRNYYLAALRCEIAQNNILIYDPEAERKRDILTEELQTIRKNLQNIYFLSTQRVIETLEKMQKSWDELSEDVRKLMTACQRCQEDLELAKLGYIAMSAAQAENILLMTFEKLNKSKPVTPMFEIDLESINSKAKSKIKSPSPLDDFLLCDTSTFTPKSTITSPKSLTDKPLQQSIELNLVTAVKPTSASQLTKPRWNCSTKVAAKVSGHSFLKFKGHSKKAKENTQAKRRAVI